MKPRINIALFLSLIYYLLVKVSSYRYRNNDIHQQLVTIFMLVELICRNSFHCMFLSLNVYAMIVDISGCSLSVFRWGRAKIFLEAFAEIVLVLESYLVGYFCSR